MRVSLLLAFLFDGKQAYRSHAMLLLRVEQYQAKYIIAGRALYAGGSTTGQFSASFCAIADCFLMMPISRSVGVWFSSGTALVPIPMEPVDFGTSFRNAHVLPVLDLLNECTSVASRREGLDLCPPEVPVVCLKALRPRPERGDKRIRNRHAFGKLVESVAVGGSEDCSLSVPLNHLSSHGGAQGEAHGPPSPRR